MIELTDEIIEKIIHRIVRTAQPEKIIMFGSHARDDAKPGSDIDLIVVVSGDIHRRKTAQDIYMNLVGVGYPADIIVLKPEDIEKYKDAVGVIIPEAIKEGKVIYAA